MPDWLWVATSAPAACALRGGWGMLSLAVGECSGDWSALDMVGCAAGRPPAGSDASARQSLPPPTRSSSRQRLEKQQAATRSGVLCLESRASTAAPACTMHFCSSLAIHGSCYRVGSGERPNIWSRAHLDERSNGCRMPMPGCQVPAKTSAGHQCFLGLKSKPGERPLGPPLTTAAAPRCRRLY